MKNQVTRRDFIALAGIGGLAASSVSFKGIDAPSKPLTVLFQGDSITDGNRGRSSDPNHILGHGYAFAIAARLGAEYPERKLTFINKGISGDTVPGLGKRWNEDALDLKPDVISILVGINDVHIRVRSGSSEPSTYEEGYRQLLKRTRESLPDAKLVLCEPFTLPVGMVNENAEKWQAELTTAQQTTRTLADEFNGIHVPFQQTFTNALKKSSADYWIWDGIHPTVYGHGLMAKEWLKRVGKVIPALSLK